MMQTYRDILLVLAEVDVWKISVWGRDPFFVRLTWSAGGKSIRIPIADGTPLPEIGAKIVEAHSSLKHLII